MGMAIRFLRLLRKLLPTHEHPVEDHREDLPPGFLDTAVDDLPALAQYISDVLGWHWRVVTVITDPQGPIVVFRDPATKRTQSVCLKRDSDSWNLRAEIEREIRKAMSERGNPDGAP
jgi:hypothetical protein